jgi:WD40 repeat protein
MPPRPHAVLEGHTAEVSRLAYTPGGHHLVSVSHGDFTLRTWEAESGRPVATARSEHRITDLALAPTGLHVYTADAAGQVAIWPLRSGQLGPPLRLLADAGQALAVSADGRWLATAGFGKPVRVWSLPDGHPVVDLGGPPTQRALAFLASGALLTAGDGTTYSVFAKTPGRLWGERWEEGRRAIGGVAPTSQIGSLDVTRDGALLVTGHNDSSIVVLDLRTRSERFNFFVRDAATRAVRWSPDGALLATAHQDATVYLWDGRTAKRLGALREHRGPVASLAFSPDGGTLASGGEDGRIVLWRGRPPGS